MGWCAGGGSRRHCLDRYPIRAVTVHPAGSMNPVPVARLAAAHVQVCDNDWEVLSALGGKVEALLSAAID